MGMLSCYDDSERGAETMFFDDWRQQQLHIKVMRIFNTYGPRVHPKDGRVVSNFIGQALVGRRQPSMAMAIKRVRLVTNQVATPAAWKLHLDADKHLDKKQFDLKYTHDDQCLYKKSKR